jgi:hypothetical protein
MSIENSDKQLDDDSSLEKKPYLNQQELKDPLSSLHNEDCEERRKFIPSINPIDYPSGLKKDKTFTLKSLNYSKNLKRF